MHEFSLCEGLVKAVLQELARLGTPSPRLLKVMVRAGSLQNIVPENMEQAFLVLTRDTPAAGATLELRMPPTCCKCKNCGWQGEIAGSFFVCPSCESISLEIVSGRELVLEGLKVEDNENKND